MSDDLIPVDPALRKTMLGALQALMDRIPEDQIDHYVCLLVWTNKKGDPGMATVNPPTWIEEKWAALLRQIADSIDAGDAEINRRASEAIQFQDPQ